MNNVTKQSRSRSTIAIIGVDLSKHSFQVHATDSKGNVLLQQTFSRQKLVEFMSTIPSSIVGIEACGSSHDWAQRIRSLGHDVRMMSPERVKPYVQRNKNDRNDAAGICEAVTRPSMKFVPIKTIEQLDMQSIHRVRSRLIAQRIQISNQLRGLLAEYGIIIPQGNKGMRSIAFLMEDATSPLTTAMRAIAHELYEEYRTLQTRRARYDALIHHHACSDERCTALQKIPGIGPLTASIFVTAMGNGHAFTKGRSCAAWLGLTPKQYASAGRSFFGKISKHGDAYIRMLLIHGGRAVVRATLRNQQRDDPYYAWVRSLVARIGVKKASVAVANKNARIAWALLAHTKAFDPQVLAVHPRLPLAA